jgi:maleylacetoacetate isomerase/maleylpyruvate isomerase
MKLYGYWRSSAAYRVRIALYLKDIAFDDISVHLVKDGGEQHKCSYQQLNPNELVPTLVDNDFVLHQSIAIIDYLEQLSSGVNGVDSLYPEQAKERAKVQAFSLDIACEIHPLNNLRVQQYLSQEMACDDANKSQWIVHWMSTGFKAIEQQLESTAGLYCFGDKVTLADICLIPQIYNAKRFKVDMTCYPYINKVVENCLVLPAFIKALPENQKDATL